MDVRAAKRVHSLGTLTRDVEMRCRFTHADYMRIPRSDTPEDPRTLGGFEFKMELQRSQHDSRLVQETVALSV